MIAAPFDESAFRFWGEKRQRVEANKGMSAQKTSDSRPLSHHVQDSLDTYFKALNGHAPSKLYDLILHQVEPPLLRATLIYCKGNQSKAADMLGLNRATLRKKLRQHGIKARTPA